MAASSLHRPLLRGDKAEDKSVKVQSLNVTIDQLEDMEIYGPNGEEIGDVDDVLVDASAKPVAISADVGGFWVWVRRTS